MTTDLIAQLGYLGVGVKDVSAWKEFATEILGLSVAEELDDGTLYLRQDEYHHRFVIEPTGEDDVKYAGWMVPTLNALEEVRARVEAEGIEVEEASPEECAYKKVAKMITFKDPDGVRLEVFYGLDVVVNAPFHSPRAITGFHAGELGLGHVLLAVKDVDVTERFYRDVLGFRVSDTSITGQGTAAERKLTFLHVNPRHHSLAMGAIPEPRHLNHWMMQLNTLDDVGELNPRVVDVDFGREQVEVRLERRRRNWIPDVGIRFINA